MKIQNPHDKFFKETFSNVAVAKDFINNYLPQSVISIIDTNTMAPQKDSFINENLQEVFSDMLFKVNINNKEGYIYFLFEHKSYKSKNISFQLLKYMLEIWEAKVKKENVDELPMIIPLVIYHGKEEWNIKSTLGEMIKGYNAIPEDVKKYIPNYEYLIYDLSKFSDDEIKGEVKLRILLTIFRDIMTKDNKAIIKTIVKTSELLRTLEDKQTGIEYFETFMRYIINSNQKLKKKDVYEIIKDVEKTYPEGSRIAMTLADQFREEGLEKGLQKGLKEGIQEGIQEGEAKALTKTVIRLLTKRFGPISDDRKSKIKKLDVITLELIIDDIFEGKDIEKYLQ